MLLNFGIKISVLIIVKQIDNFLLAQNLSFLMEYLKVVLIKNFHDFINLKMMD